MIINVLFSLGIIYLAARGVCRYNSKLEEVKIETDSYEYQKELNMLMKEHDEKDFKDLKEIIDWNYQAYDRLRKVKYKAGNER